MNRRLFRRLLVNLLAGAVIALVAVNPLEAATKKTFSSKLFCDAVKVGCAKKVSKTKSAKTVTKKTVTKKTVTNKKKTKQPVVKTASRSKTKPIARPRSDQAPVLPIAKLAPTPRPKPSTVQPDTSKLATAAIEHAPPLERPNHEPPYAAQESVPPDVGVICRAGLLQLGVDFSVPDHVEAAGQCMVVDPVQLTSIKTSTGEVALPGAPILNCEFARQFTVWVSDIAAPVVAALGEARLFSLSTGPGYECRGRNGDSSAKISEHAFGNAIDIDGITLANKKRIEIPDVADKQDSDHRLLMALRISACGYFTTVLGPGADAAHASHYHFDLGIHGKSGNYRICE